MFFLYSVGVWYSVLLPTDLHHRGRPRSCGLHPVIFAPNHGFRTSRPHHPAKVPTGLRFDRVDEAKVWHHYGLLS